MNRILLSVVIIASLLSLQKGWAQKDSDKKELPSSLIKTVQQITRGSSQPEEKFKKIAQWIIENKKFDVKGFENFRLETYSIEKSFKQKKLLPGEYSLLLTSMCKEAGIPCNSIDGYTKSSGHYPFKKFYYNNYSWNIVNLNGSYSIVDLTGASGNLILKKTFSESLKNKMHIPSSSSKYMFKKEFNPTLLNIPIEEAFDKLMPYTPMWQLKDNPYPIDNFEMGIKENLKTDAFQTIAYKNLIANYEGKEKSEQFLFLAEEGIKFNSKNNLNTGIYYLAYCQQKFNELKNGGWASENDLKIKSKELIGYTNKAATNIDKFINDNKNINKKCIDSLNKKTREIGDFNSKNKKEAQNTIKTLTKKEYTNEKAIIKNEGIIAKKEIEQLTRSNQKVILQIRKSLSKKNVKDSTSFWMEIYQKNERRINHERALFAEIDSNIAVFENERTILWDSVLQMFNSKLIVIAKACDENLKSNDLVKLRTLHQNYAECHVTQLKLEKELIQKETQYKTQSLKRIDSLNRVITLIVNQNKRLLFKIKRFSPLESSNQIDSLYELQNDFVEECHKRSVDNFYRWDLYLKLWNVEYKARKNISNYISNFSDKYNKVEKVCYKRHSGIEQLRYKKYNSHSIRLRNQCEEMKENISQFSKSNPVKKVEK